MNKTVNEIPKALFDATVRMQIATGRYASKTVRDIIGLLNQADADIMRKIAATDAPFTKARLAALLKEIRTVYREIYSEAGTELRQQMLDFAGVRADQTAALIATQLPVNYNIIQATAEQLKAIVDVVPVTVGPDKKLLLEEIFTSLANGKEEAIRGAIRLGMVQGETVDQMVRRIKGTKSAQYKDGILEVHRRHAESICRTVVNHTSNQAMQATYANNAKVVSGWRFLSTLDSRTSISCAALSNTVWPVGKGPIPPRHVNCRSVAIPEIKTWREMGFDIDELPPGMRASKDGLVRSDISFQDWLKGQDKGTQVDILGKTRAELFRSGKLPLQSFTDDKGRVLSLDQLKGVSNIMDIGGDVTKQYLKQLIDEPQKFVDFIVDKIGEDFSGAVGIRGLYKGELDGKLKESFNWIDGTRTGKKIGGTSSLLISGDWEYDPASIIKSNIQKYAKKVFMYGDTDSYGLVIGELKDTGDDIGEIIIRNAKLVHIWS